MIGGFLSADKRKNHILKFVLSDEGSVDKVKADGVGRLSVSGGEGRGEGVGGRGEFGMYLGETCGGVRSWGEVCSCRGVVGLGESKDWLDGLGGEVGGWGGEGCWGEVGRVKG